MKKNKPSTGQGEVESHDEAQNRITEGSLGGPSTFAENARLLKFIVPGILALIVGGRYAFVETLRAQQEKVNQTGVDRTLWDLPSDVLRAIENAGKSYDQREREKEEALQTEYFEKLSNKIDFDTKKLVDAHSRFIREVTDKVGIPCTAEENDRLANDLKDAVADCGQNFLNVAGNSYPQNPQRAVVIDSCATAIEELQKMSQKNLPANVMTEIVANLDLIPKLKVRKAEYEDKQKSMTSL